MNVGHNLMSPNIRILGNGTELVWYSELDGWGHLYLYDITTGKLKRQLTSGNWTVFDIVHVDEENRVLFFTAGGRESGRDPYYRHLYRTSLDGGDIVLLTPEDADHEFGGRSPLQAGFTNTSPLSPAAEYIIDTFSTVDIAPVSVLRSALDGRLITPLEEADASALYAAGYRPPQRFSVLSADGKTRLYGVLNLPSDFDPGKSYPVIDAIYGGPVSVVATRSFGSFADPQLEDHVAALQQLAERYPFLDIGRVGVYGHSNGGYLSARALLKHPDIFKVGFASASPHNFQGLPGTGAPWFGIPRYANGSAIRPEINAVPENYKVLDNAGLADQLQGKLMLVCGELDSAAFPALTMQLANALIKANKNFDFMYLPGATHMYFVQDMYVTRRLWDYFVEHLAGETPPEGFNMRKRGPEKGSGKGVRALFC